MSGAERPGAEGERFFPLGVPLTANDPKRAVDRVQRLQPWWKHQGPGLRGRDTSVCWRGWLSPSMVLKSSVEKKAQGGALVSMPQRGKREVARVPIFELYSYGLRRCGPM